MAIETDLLAFLDRRRNLIDADILAQFLPALEIGAVSVTAGEFLLHCKRQVLAILLVLLWMF